MQKITSMIALVIIVIAWIAMTPVVVDEVQGINTTGWSFTGYEGAEALIGLVPFVWIGAGLAMLVVGLFALAKTSGAPIKTAQVAYIADGSFRWRGLKPV